RLPPAGSPQAARPVADSPAAPRPAGCRRRRRRGGHRGTRLVHEQAPRRGLLTGSSPTAASVPYILRPIYTCLKLKVKNCVQGFRIPGDRSTKDSTARETKDIREDYLVTQFGPTDRAWTYSTHATSTRRLRASRTRQRAKTPT